MRAKDHRAGRRGVLVCSLLATLSECFAIKHTHTCLPSIPRAALV